MGNNITTTESLYVLRLDDEKLYVGKCRTDRIDERIAEHKSGKGSAWTRKHKFVSLLEQRPCNSNFEEDALVLELMSKCGIDNVRGGSYSQVKLDFDTTLDIKKKINHATGACLKCGSLLHYVKDCKCDRCGRNNHITDNCYAKTHIDGTILKS